jgi:hypothetical protein
MELLRDEAYLYRLDLDTLQQTSVDNSKSAAMRQFRCR